MFIEINIMTSNSKEENKKSSADFSAERNDYYRLQHSTKKMIQPRIEPTTSAKASEEVEMNDEDVETVATKVEADNEQTVIAVMEALTTVGEEASKHLSASDKKYIKKVCLQESDTNIYYIGIVLIVLSFLLGKNMSR
jgi:hypothetical protein